MAIRKIDYNPYGFENWTEVEISKVDALYKKAWAELKAETERVLKLEADGTPVSRSAKARLAGLLKEYKKQISGLTEEVNKRSISLIDSTIDITKGEVALPVAGLLSWDDLNSRAVNEFLRQGEFLKEFVTSENYYRERQLLGDVESILRRGFLERNTWQEISTDLAVRFGAPPEEIKNIRGYRATTGEAYRAKRLLRTESARMHMLGQNTFAENSEFVIGLEWKLGSKESRDDDSPCEECRDLAGDYYYPDRTEEEGKGNADEIVGMLPVHPNCMCHVIPIYRSLDEIAADAEREAGEWFETDEGQEWLDNWGDTLEVGI